MSILEDAFAHPRGLMGRLGGLIMGRMSGERNAWIVSLLDVQRSDHILEVGFGPGTVIESLANRATEGFVAGIDASPLMVREASRRNLRAIHDGRVHLEEGDALALPFEEGMFDKALAINSVQIWPDPLAGMREMRRVLKPGGLLALALQPVWVKTDDEVRALGKELAERMESIGLHDVRLEYKELRPRACVCVLGRK